MDSDKMIIALQRAIYDGDKRTAPYIWRIYKESKKYKELYIWFVHNQITGAKFYDFWAERSFSLLRVVSSVIGKIELEKRKKVLEWKKLN